MEKPENGKILVTGMGSSFGLLYSAVHHIQPDLIIVITSERFRDMVAEACIKAGFNDRGRIRVFTMDDVFAGFNETPALLQGIWPQIETAGKIIINLTGGTTAMHWIVQSIYEEASKNRLSVERVAFVDRRPTVEQQQNPWKLGEMVEIEKIMNYEK